MFMKPSHDRLSGTADPFQDPMMKQRTSQILYQYWNDVRGERLAPDRFEIEPAQISTILPETCMIQRGDDGQLAFRLAGTRVCDNLGRELRGTELQSVFLEADRLAVESIVQTVTDQGAVGLLEFEMASEDGRAVRFEMILLPLTHMEKGITRFLGAVSAIDPPAWMGSVKLATRGLVGHSIMWPDGRPHALIERAKRQSPFLAVMANARVVRSDRRQFRVFDGGLLSRPTDK